MKRHLAILSILMCAVMGLTIHAAAADGTEDAGYAAAVENNGITYYADLETAWQAIPADGTETIITLLADAEASGLVVKAGQNIVWRGGAYTLSNPVTWDAIYDVRGTFTVESGTIRAKGSVVRNNGGTVVICGGTLISTEGDCVSNTSGGSMTVDGAHAVVRAEQYTAVVNTGTFCLRDGRIEGCSVCVINDGCMEMYGGTVSAQERNNQMIGIALEGGTLLLEDGIIEAKTPVGPSGLLTERNLILSGGPSFVGIENGIYIREGEKITVTDALQVTVPVEPESFADGTVIAVGAEGYSLTDADAEKFVLSDAGYFCALAENAVLLREVHIHSYTDTVVPPTCTEQGYTLHVCDTCGDRFADTYTASVDHDWQETKDPMVWKCAACGETKTESVSGTCGTHLTWTLDGEGILTISGSGEMENYAYNDYAPWYDFIRKIKKIQVEEGVTSIGDRAFYRCQQAEEIDLPDSLKTIGQNGISYCKKLEEIVLPEGLLEIGEEAFYDCETLKMIVIPASVTRIENPFGLCRSLERIEVDPSNNSYCALEGVLFNKDGTELLQYPINKAGQMYAIPEGVQRVKTSAFWNASFKNISIPASMSEIDRMQFNSCNQLESISVHKDNSAYTAVDGVLFSKDRKTLVRYPGGKTEEIYQVPDSVTAIGDYAFRENGTLTDIFLPSGLGTIGSYAFYGCEELAAIDLPDTVTAIDSSAFNGCRSLTEIVLPPELDEIESFLFSNCTALKNVMIPEKAEHIGFCAFYGCTQLETVHFTSENTVSVESGNTYFEDAQHHPVLKKADRIEPTCMQKGSAAVFVCTECDWERSGIELPALGHDGTLHPARPATCNASGWDAYVTCGRCAYTTYAEIPATGKHEWSDWGWLDAGHHSRQCASCKETEQQAHAFAAGYCELCGRDTVDIFVLCSGLQIECGFLTAETKIMAAGYDGGGRMMASMVCTPDELEDALSAWEIPDTAEHIAVYFMDEQYIPLRDPRTIPRADSWTAHEYMETAYLAPTCTEDGQRVFTCSICSDVYTEVLSAAGHTEIDLPAAAPTCTAAGRTEGRGCSVCKAVLSGQDTIPATGHQWSAGSCTVAQTCQNCKKTNGSAPGHTWSNWLLKDEEVHGRSCRVCKYSETEAHRYIGSYCRACSPNSADIAFAGGSGTEDDPYLIANKAQLDAVRNDLSAHYKLINDIAFTAKDFAAGGEFHNNGAGWIPIGLTADQPFEASFEGDNKRISGLEINAEVFAEDMNSVGLFGYSTGYISDIYLTGKIRAEGPVVTAGSIIGNNNGYVINCINEASVSTGEIITADTSYISLESGGIAGSNSCVIAYCANRGTIGAGNYFYETLARTYTGGIAAFNSGTIHNCFNQGEVNSVARGTGSYVNAAGYSGGIAACNSSAIRESFNLGDVRAYGIHRSANDLAYAGGVVGMNYAEATIKDTFNTGLVYASANEESYAGGIAGTTSHTKDSPEVQISCSYNYGELSAGRVGGIVGKSHFSNDLSVKYDSPIYYCVYPTGVPCVGKSGGVYEVMECRSANDAGFARQSTFTGFDFNTVWVMETVEFGLPMLQWFMRAIQ